MNTQISVLFKKELGQNNIKLFMFDFREKIKLQIDNSAPQIIVPDKKPYIFDVAPGTHTIYFKDEKQKSKKILTGLFVGAATAGFGLGAGLRLEAAAAGYSIGRGNTDYDSMLDITVNEGDIAKLRVRTTTSGKVKIKQLK